MKLSISRSRESLWVWLFWGLGMYLVLELAASRVAAQVLNKSAGQLAGPYLAFAVPWAIFAPLIWWLRKWEERGAAPKRLARAWGLGVALYGAAAIVAAFYSGNVLLLIEPADAWGGFVATILLAVPILYLVMYHKALATISARAAGRRGGV